MLTEQEQYFRVRLNPVGSGLAGMPTARLGQINLPAPLQTGKDVYAEWHWDGREVVIRNCRLGFFPIYYYATVKEFGVSPSIDQLLVHGAPVELDDAAMAVYLRLGWTLAEDTVFRSIRALPPGGTVRWSGGIPQVTGGFSHPARLNIGRETAIDTFADLVRHAVRRRASKDVPFVLPLSGGRDSRSIFLELCEQGYRPQVCVTNHDFPPYRTQNIEIARELARRVDLPHQSLGQPASRLQTELRKNRLNDYCAIENIWCVNLYAEIVRRYDNPIVYEGSPGGTYFGAYGNNDLLHLLEQDRGTDVARKLLNKWQNWQSAEEALQRVLTPEAAGRFSLELAVERLHRELTRHLDAANPITAFYFWNRGRHVSAMQPFSIARRAGVMAVTPYLDHDLVDFLAALPPKVSLDKAFHGTAIHQTYPAFSDIPFAGDTPTPPIESNRHYRRFFLESLTYLGTHGTGKLVQRGPMLRRLAGLAVSGGNLRMRMKWTAPYTALYLTQIESLLQRYGKSR
jgi:asparagine synthase (glutamine-hydrolysing)